MSLDPTSNLRHSPSFQWLRLCFCLCAQSILLSSFAVVSISSSVSFLKEMSLSWSLHVFEQCPSSFSSSVLSRSSVSSFSLVSSFRFPIFFVSPFRLYYESKHFALRRLNHSFMLFCECRGSRGVVHRRGYHCVEKPKLMSKHGSSRC